MVRVRFPNTRSEIRALGFLAKRFSLTTFKSGKRGFRQARSRQCRTREFYFPLKDGSAMTRSYRRYEVLLPKRFNNGKPVPDALVGKTLREFNKQFGAVSCETQTIRGLWRYGGKVYRDELMRVF